MRCSMLNLLSDEGYGLKNMGPRLSLSKGIHNTVADQPHGLSMTPVSIKQLRALYDES
jgi:hypothetical protein